MIIHKSNARQASPKVSIILLDWSVREHFQALDWLPDQTVPRAEYELIWIDLYNRVPARALERADVVITCGQRGQYHKHKGYNIGLLQAQGQIITICDSDAIFPREFVESILVSFQIRDAGEPISLVLNHYQRRTTAVFPEDLARLDQLARYTWLELWPNVGACMSVRRSDALRFGGFDEHRSYRGYLCGPYDLGWRLINAGVPELWHDPAVVLWHFAHPNPVAGFGQAFSFKLWREIAGAHIDHHALTAVEAFSTGRVLPLKENGQVFKQRLAMRQIGTPFEARYATMTGQEGFNGWERLRFRLAVFDSLKYSAPGQQLRRHYHRLRRWSLRYLLLWGGEWGARLVNRLADPEAPEPIKGNYKGFSIVLYRRQLYAFAATLGAVNPCDEQEVALLQARQQCLIAGRLPDLRRHIRLIASRTDSVVLPPQ